MPNLNIKTHGLDAKVEIARKGHCLLNCRGLALITVLATLPIFSDALLHKLVDYRQIRDSDNVYIYQTLRFFGHYGQVTSHGKHMK